MEIYVKSVLLKKKDQSFRENLSQSLQPRADQQAQSFVSPQSRRTKRADSLERAGTGRYALGGDNLGNCIATEKGLLKREDFEHVQKIIEIYSKALLVEVRAKHHKERSLKFSFEDWYDYTELVFEQQQAEVKIFNRATLEILNVANIKASVFNQSVQLYLITSQDSLLASARLSLYSPFEVEERLKNFTCGEVNEYFRKICAVALEVLESKKMMNVINKKIY